MRAANLWKQQIIADYNLNECLSLKSYLQKEVDALARPKSLADRLPFPLTALAQLLSKPYNPNWLVKNFLLEDITCMIYGEPASRKSFIVQQLGFCISAGIQWHGEEVSQGAVVYVAGEGQSGLRPRFKALENHYGVSAENFYVSDVPATLIEQENTSALEASITTICNETDEELKLLIIDTLHRNMGGDENSSSDVSLMLNNLDKFRNKFKCTIILIHHTGHGEKNRARGSSSLRAAMDMEYHIQTKSNVTSMTCTKSKDFEEPDTLRFAPTIVNTGDIDESGTALSSIVLERTEISGLSFLPQLTENQQITMNALRSALNEKGLEPNIEFKETVQKLGCIDSELPSKVVNKSTWREYTYPLLVVNAGSNENDAKRKTFDRAIARLESLGHVTVQNNCCWIQKK